MPDMYPVMEVIPHFQGGTRHFELVLSQANLNHFFAGCPDFDRLIGSYQDISFSIFPGILEKPLAFKAMYSGYYLNLGAAVPIIPADASHEEFDRLNMEYCQNIERVIRESGKIPMKMETPFGERNLGYVTLKIED